MIVSVISFHYSDFTKPVKQLKQSLSDGQTTENFY